MDDAEFVLMDCSEVLGLIGDMKVIVFLVFGQTARGERFALSQARARLFAASRRSSSSSNATSCLESTSPYVVRCFRIKFSMASPRALMVSTRPLSLALDDKVALGASATAR